jgi:hypothetical protein
MRTSRNEPAGWLGLQSAIPGGNREGGRSFLPGLETYQAARSAGFMRGFDHLIDPDLIHVSLWPYELTALLSNLAE